MRYTGYRLSTVISLLLLLTLTACANLFDITHAENTLRPGQASPITASSTVPLDLGIPQAALQAPSTNTLPDNTPLHVVITFKLKAAALTSLTSHSEARAGQPLDAHSLASQVGITDAQYRQMQNFFGGPGITLRLNAPHTYMTMDALSSVLAAHLHTQFLFRVYKGVLFFAPSPSIELPRSIANLIDAISGLDSYSRYPTAQPATTSFVPLRVHTNSDGCFSQEDDIFPWQIRQAYGLNPLYQRGWTGKGTTIVLPEFNTFPRADVQQYFDCEGFHGRFSVVTVDHAAPKKPDLEPLLDIEMVAGLAPDANIVVYQTEAGANYENFWPKLQDVLNQISDDYSNHAQPVMVSISWGGTEGYLSQDMLKTIHNTLQTMTLVEHITIFSASGDCGAYDSGDYPNTLDVGFPSSDPYSLSVGGTFLYVDGRGNRTNEIAWSHKPTSSNANCQNDWGSGGGLSSEFPRPSWQQGYTGIQNKYSNGQRQVPDISAAAYYLGCYFDGQWGYCAGTSAATPIWDSSYAVVNSGLASSTGYYLAGPAAFYALARQYSNTHPFYDVVKGDNLYYQTTPGWDYVTGLGTPNLAGIYQGLVQYIHSGA